MAGLPSQFGSSGGQPDLMTILQALLAQSGGGQMTGQPVGSSGKPQPNSSPFPGIQSINTPTIPFMPNIPSAIPGTPGALQAQQSQGGGGKGSKGSKGGKGGGKGSGSGSSMGLGGGAGLGGYNLPSDLFLA